MVGSPTEAAMLEGVEPQEWKRHDNNIFFSNQEKLYVYSNMTSRRPTVFSRTLQDMNLGNQC